MVQAPVRLHQVLVLAPQAQVRPVKPVLAVLVHQVPHPVPAAQPLPVGQFIRPAQAMPATRTNRWRR